ncbi:MAG: right-handed parallel beta-helix repeat-containing protein [Candidatus Binatia bacterium]
MEQVGKLLKIAAAVFSALWLSGIAWAGDSIKPINNCGTLTADAQSSFVLVQNVFSLSETCLIVKTSNITIDLNGFTIFGVGFGTGIVADAPVEGITIRNGTVKGFKVGVSLAGTGNIVRDLRVDNNTDTGIFLGSSSLVDHVVAQNNRHFGIVVTTASTVKDSVLRLNGSTPDSIALSAGRGGTITGNTIWSSIGTGLFASSGSTVLGNTVLETDPGFGMSIICPSNIKNNTATFNTRGDLVLNGNGCNAFDNVTPVVVTNP